MLPPDLVRWEARARPKHLPNHLLCLTGLVICKGLIDRELKGSGNTLRR